MVSDSSWRGVILPGLRNFLNKFTSLYRSEELRAHHDFCVKRGYDAGHRWVRSGGKDRSKLDEPVHSDATEGSLRWKDSMNEMVSPRDVHKSTANRWLSLIYVSLLMYFWPFPRCYDSFTTTFSGIFGVFGLKPCRVLIVCGTFKAAIPHVS